MYAPLMKPASRLARKHTSSPTSEGRPKRGMSEVLMSAFSNAAGSSACFTKSVTMSVAMAVGP